MFISHGLLVHNGSRNKKAYLEDAFSVSVGLLLLILFASSCVVNVVVFKFEVHGF
uniref:Uncharacterized protein n=1 Tax=Rhizophora mucronata TaxID=61149 RepID=A0A2P2P6V7_RHIMU